MVVTIERKMNSFDTYNDDVAALVVCTIYKPGKSKWMGDRKLIAKSDLFREYECEQVSETIMLLNACLKWRRRRFYSGGLFCVKNTHTNSSSWQ
jgi:hypothetical protein